MIHPQTGEYRMIDETYVSHALADGMLVMKGTETEVAAVGHRIRLGAREQDARAKRRKQQRDSRRGNRH